MSKNKGIPPGPKIMPDPESNYFRVPNQFIDEYYKDMPPSALKVYLLLIRKTWGFQKSGDWVSMSQFIDETGMSKNTILKSLTWLKDNEFIWSTRVGNPGKEQNLYFVMKESNLAMKKMFEDKLIDKSYLKKMIEVEKAKVKYRKSVDLGTF